MSGSSADDGGRGGGRKGKARLAPSARVCPDLASPQPVGRRGPRSARNCLEGPALASDIGVKAGGALCRTKSAPAPVSQHRWGVSDPAHASQPWPEPYRRGRSRPTCQCPKCAGARVRNARSIRTRTRVDFRTKSHRESSRVRLFNRPRNVVGSSLIGTLHLGRCKAGCQVDDQTDDQDRRSGHRRAWQRDASGAGESWRCSPCARDHPGGTSHGFHAETARLSETALAEDWDRPERTTRGSTCKRCGSSRQVLLLRRVADDRSVLRSYSPTPDTTIASSIRSPASRKATRPPSCSTRPRSRQALCA